MPGMAPRTPIAALALLAILALTLLACDLTPSAVQPTVQVTLDGRPLRVLVAGPDGMRGREFGDADAMLFAWAEDQDPAAVRFVMDGVEMPLDVAFFDAEGRWLGTSRMEPCTAAPCDRYTSPGPFRWALEAPAGGILVQLGADARLEVDGG
jgi:uncharacterized membrane protein (UPF0127 family)